MPCLIYFGVFGISLWENSLEFSKLIKNSIFLRKNKLTAFKLIFKRLLIGTNVRYVDFRFLCDLRTLLTISLHRHDSMIELKANLQNIFICYRNDERLASSPLLIRNSTKEKSVGFIDLYYLVCLFWVTEVHYVWNTN